MALTGCPAAGRHDGAVLLRTGRLNLAGTAPNGQRFVATPHGLWLIASSRASIDGVDAGRPAPLATQASMGDFYLPQRGLLMLTSARFDRALPAAAAPPLAPRKARP